MTINGWIQIAIFCLAIIICVKPLGGYMARLFEGERTFLSPLLAPVERFIYRLCGIDEADEQRWTQYTIAMLVFLFLLAEGLVWAWQKGILEWV